MGIKWQDKVTNVEVLERAGLTSIEALLMKSQLRWAGHVARMENSRLPKQIFYSELTQGVRGKGRPLLRYKDTLKERLISCKLPHNTWEALAADRKCWRSTITKGVSKFENERMQLLKDKRAERKNSSCLSNSGTVKCPVCGKLCVSDFGLRAHSRVHKGK